MSSNERHRLSKRFRTLCATCQERKARFEYRSGIRADRDHTLCFECYRGEINRAKARRLTDAVPPRIGNDGGLNERQLAHRIQMLAHLRRPSSVSQAQLADRLGITQSAIAQLESAQPKNVELRTLVRVAVAVGAAVDASIRPRRQGERKSRERRLKAKKPERRVPSMTRVE